MKKDPQDLRPGEHHRREGTELGDLQLMKGNHISGVNKRTPVIGHQDPSQGPTGSPKLLRYGDKKEGK